MSQRALALALALAGCHGGTSPETPDAASDAAPTGGTIQMNDVSILFPLAPATQLGTGYLAAASHGARGVLLPEKLYDAAGHLSGSSGPPSPGGSGEATYASLRVVAMRLDPCFAALAPDPHGAGCTNQLRLVFQELDEVDGKLVAFDSALHAFYELSREDLVALAHAIASLRAASSSGERLGALAPHPLMAAQGLDGAMADGVRKLILQYAGEHNLTRVAEMSALNTGFSWAFSGFDVADATAATITPLVIPSVAAGTTSQTFFRGFGTAIEGQFTPATTSADDLAPLANATTAAQLSPAARQAAFDSLVRVDHPARNSANTIDCASCHLATPVSRLIAKAQFALDETTASGAFHADGVHVLPSEMTATFDDTARRFDVHAFSYVDDSPTINQRTVNETAAVVAYLNQL